MKLLRKLDSRIFYRALDLIEKAGNRLPHPTSLFAIFALGVILVSGIASVFGLSAIHPGTGQPIQAVSLLNGDGLRRIVTEMVRNFTNFAPLGTVLVALLGIGVAEGTGLLGAAIRLLVLSAPPRLLTAVVVFAGIMSNAASEIGYVLLVPLGAVIFLAVGRHPLAGLAAAFGGVSAGYSANLLIGTVDPLLAGLSQEAARILDPNYLVNPACNYYFMAASTFALTLAGAWVAEKIVEPRLGQYQGDEKSSELQALSAEEKRGLKFAAGTLVVIAALIAWTVVPSNGVLRDPKTGDLLHSPFLSGIVALLFFSSAAVGIAYGIGAGTVRKDADVINAMSKAMGTLASYITLVFFAAQFVAYFSWTNIGLIIAVKGAEFLKAVGFQDIPLLVSFIAVSAFLNLFMGSASAKWAIMAPVFVPMFMLLGYAPELTQAAYRIGDSCSNVVSPMMSYFALIVAFVQRYSKGAGIGTVIAAMLPFTITFLVTWSALLSLWLLFALPLGPGAPLYLSTR